MASTDDVAELVSQEVRFICYDWQDHLSQARTCFPDAGGDVAFSYEKDFDGALFPARQLYRARCGRVGQ